VSSPGELRGAGELDEKGFKGFCSEINLNAQTVQANIEMVKEFEAFLRKKHRGKGLSNATVRDLRGFVARLMMDEKDTWDNLLALLRYSRFSKNRMTEIALIELLDGSDVLQNLSDKLKQAVGKDKHDEIFEGIELPRLGTHARDKPMVTRQVMERLEARLDEETLKEILSSGLHAPEQKKYLRPERRKFLKSKGIDEYLEKRHKEFVDELEKHAREKTLFFTQEIDGEVVEYIRNNPVIHSGVRQGDVIHVTKIPYMAKKYLHEKDEKRKRYYYCHCPWVREAIRSDLEISPNFCYCSAGFMKQVFDVIFDQPVKADMLKTVLKGDMVCEFAIHIPQEYLKSRDHRDKRK